MFYRGAVSVWKPKVTPMSQLRPGEVKQPTANGAGGDTEPYVQRTSLAANKQVIKNNFMFSILKD